MTLDKRQRLWESLYDPEYRQQFADEHINVGIAFQIRRLRESQELSQTKLAEKLGDKKRQPLVSQWENPNYGRYSLATLRDLAHAFDVALLVRFVPFSTLVDWSVNLSPDRLAPASFAEERQLGGVRIDISSGYSSGAVTDATGIEIPPDLSSTANPYVPPGYGEAYEEQKSSEPKLGFVHAS